jgi:hypothetical protein
MHGVWGRRASGAAARSPSVEEFVLGADVTHAQAPEQVTVARRLQELPEMDAAYREGQIPYHHSAVIATCARKIGVEVAAGQGCRTGPPRELDPIRLRLGCHDLEHRVGDCDVPPRRCGMHHLTPVSKGGQTVINDLALVCRRHHHLPHEKVDDQVGRAGELVTLPA